MRRSLFPALALFACLTSATLADPAAPLNDLDGLQPSLPKAQTSASLAPVNDGAALLGSGRSLEAEELLAKATADLPTCAEAFYNYGLALAFNGKHEPALGAFRRALEIRAGFPEAHLALGTSQLTLGKPEEALTAFETALAQAPDTPTGHAALFNKGTALGRLKRFTEAELALSEALAADPDDPAPAFQIGKMKMQQEKWQDALSWLEAASASFPLESFLLSGRAHVRLQQREAAEKALALAAERLEKEPPAEDIKTRLAKELSSLREEAAKLGAK